MDEIILNFLPSFLSLGTFILVHFANQSTIISNNLWWCIWATTCRTAFSTHLNKAINFGCCRFKAIVLIVICTILITFSIFIFEWNPKQAKGKQCIAQNQLSQSAHCIRFLGWLFSLLLLLFLVSSVLVAVSQCYPTNAGNMISNICSSAPFVCHQRRKVEQNKQQKSF